MIEKIVQTAMEWPVSEFYETYFWAWIIAGAIGLDAGILLRH